MKIPHAYQQEVIDAGARRNLLIADEMGLGKTLEAVEIGKQCQQQVGGFNLVIAPLKTLANWQDTIFEQAPGVPILRLSKNFDHKALADYATAWCITHYEAVVFMWPQLRRVKWTTAIVDEAHRIKTRVTKAKRKKMEARQAQGVKVRTPVTEAVKEGTVYAQRKLALTGTPWDKDPADLWSILNWLYPHRYTSYWRFRETYTAVEYNFMGYEKAVGCIDPNGLAAELRPYTFARTKKQVAPQLPPRIDQVIRVEMAERQARLYEQLRTSRDLEVLLSLEEIDLHNTITVGNALALIVRLQQMSSDPRLLGFPIASGKIEWIHEFLADNAGMPVVVFTKFRDTAIRLAEELDADLLVGSGSGAVQSARPAAAFLDGHKRVLVGTIGAMREGLNLQRASTAIFLDQDWSSIAMTQAADRIHRIDITEPKTVIFLQSSSVDRLVYRAFRSKWTEAELVFNVVRELRGQSETRSAA